MNNKIIDHPIKHIAGRAVDMIEEIKGCVDGIYRALMQYETHYHYGRKAEAKSAYKLYLRERDFFTAQVEEDGLKNHHKIECYEVLILAIRKMMRHECDYYKMNRVLLAKLNQYLTLILQRVMSLEEHHSVYAAHEKSYQVFEGYYREEARSERPDQHILDCYLIIMSKIKNRMVDDKIINKEKE